jgi:hypothetical protein
MLGKSFSFGLLRRCLAFAGLCAVCSSAFRRPEGLRRCLAFACLWAPALAALELGAGDWQIHGFLSQGYTHTSGNRFFGDSRGSGSLDFTEAGVNLSGHLAPNLLLAAQGLYRNAGGSDREKARLDFANLDYRLPWGETGAIGVRMGRVKNPFGLYNSARDVVWTRPGATLPQSVYFDALALRQPMIASDGGLLYARRAFGDHALSAEFVVSEPLDDTGGAAAFLTGIPDPKGTLGGRPLFIGRAGYEWREGLLRVLFTVVDLDRDFKSASRAVPSGNVKAFYPLASVQVNLERWSFTGEYGQVNVARSGFTPGGIAVRNASESFYLQSEYRFAPGWTALLRYDAFFANLDDPSGKRSARLTGLPRRLFYARDFTAGLRCEFAPNWLASAEYHRVHGAAWLSPIDNRNLPRDGGEESWNLFALMLSWRF